MKWTLHCIKVTGVLQLRFRRIPSIYLQSEKIKFKRNQKRKKNHTKHEDRIEEKQHRNKKMSKSILFDVTRVHGTN